MTKILHLDANPRSKRSHSRRLADQFISSWQKIYANNVILYIGVEAKAHSLTEAEAALEKMVVSW